jgi:uncharacterized membrane protein YccC
MDMPLPDWSDTSSGKDPEYLRAQAVNSALHGNRIRTLAGNLQGMVSEGKQLEHARALRPALSAAISDLGGTVPAARYADLSRSLNLLATLIAQYTARSDEDREKKRMDRLSRLGAVIHSQAGRHHARWLAVRK